jgi:uncharacterized SAM-binding protein YcdF (DUF218 family)
MFHIFSKLFTLFLMPFFWLFFAVCYAFFAKSEKKRKRWLLISFLILFVFGNSFLASKIMNWWEPRPLEYAKMDNFDVGIVLCGGIANDWKRPWDRMHFDPEADRLLQALQLYKAGKIKNILISGGSANIFNRNNIRTEATIGKEFLIKVGVPAEKIFIEGKSINTFENAKLSKSLLISEKLIDKKLLLITSAYHMKRSKACFDKQGVLTTTFPTAYHQINTQFWALSTIIPDETAFALWFDLCHEWFGIVSYKIMGYI